MIRVVEEDFVQIIVKEGTQLGIKGNYSVLIKCNNIRNRNDFSVGLKQILQITLKQ